MKGKRTTKVVRPSRKRMVLFTLAGIIMAALSSIKVQAQYSCASAVTITDGYTATGITTPGTGGAEDWVTSATTCGATSSYYTASDAYVFSYTTGASAGESFVFAIRPDRLHDWYALGVFSSCSAGALSGCIAEDETPLDSAGLSVCATNLAASTTYYIVVSRWGSPDDLDFDVVDFAVDTAGIIPDDECATATAIDISEIFNGSTSCNYTPSTGSPSGCGSIENDSWMSFTAGADSVTIDYEIPYCSDEFGNYGVQLSVWEGSCASLTLLTGSCVNPANGTGTWSFDGMTVGDTYYVRIDGYAGQLCGYTLTPGEGVATNPENDDCPNYQLIACGESDTSNTVLATNIDAPSGCTNGGTPDQGVWYQFVGTGNSITLTTDDAATNFDTQINVYSGDCNNLTCVAGDDDSGTGTTSSVTFSTTNGTDYYIYVDGDGTAMGTFVIRADCSSCGAEAGTWN